MKTTIIITLLLCALALICPAQTTTEPPSTASYFVATGVGYNRAYAPHVTGWMAVGACLEKTGTCPYTEFENITGITTTMQAGVLQRLAASGNLRLSALGQIGGATTDGTLTGVFSGGLVLAYSRPKWNGVSIIFPIKVQKVNGTDVTLAFGFGISKRF